MKKLFLLLLMFFSTLAFSQTDSTKVKKFEETDKVLAKILDKSLVMAEKTGQFVIEQAPEVVKEFYLWNTYSNIFWIVTSILMILFVRYFPILFLAKEESYANDERYFNRWGGESVWWIYFSLIVVSVIGGITILICIYDLVFLLVSPKLYLIEYVMHLRQS